MKVLSIEQMNKLKELGVDTGIASMAIYDIYAGENKVYDIIASNGAFPEDQEYDRFGYGIHSAVAFCKKPVFTLQDIIELLPENVVIKRKKTYHTFYLNVEKYSSTNWCVSYENDDLFLVSHSTSNPLDSSYNMLITCIQESYLKTK